MLLQIKIEELKKSYKTGFDLYVDSLEVFASSTLAIFGANGSGKSTFFKLISGNLEKDGGKILFNEEIMTQKSYKLKKCVGYLPQESLLPMWSTPLELLRYASALYGVEDPEERVRESMLYWDCQKVLNKTLLP